MTLQIGSETQTTEFKAEAWRGATGGHRVGQTRGGQWWWVRPGGERTVACGVQKVSGSAQWSEPTTVLAALRSWGCNLLGAGAAPEFLGAGLPSMPSLELRIGGPCIRTGGSWLPDVFDPRWPAHCRERAAAARRGTDVFGIVSDAELRWAQPSSRQPAAARPTLLQLCLALEPSFAAYHAAWEFVLAPHGGQLDTLADAWGVSLPNRQTLRQWTAEEIALSTPGYLADLHRFTREFAERYFRTAASAVREVEPGRLFLGAPVSTETGDLLPLTASRFVDVLLWREGVPTLDFGPVLVVDFNWTNASGELSPDTVRLSSLERMHRAGRAGLEALLIHPNVVGYTWSDWSGGDRSEQAPFGRGWVYADGSVAHEHVLPLASIHALAAVRRVAAAVSG